MGVRGTVLVTGANGHVGNNLVKALAARGHAVRATVRLVADESRTAPLRGLDNVELASLDVRDHTAFEAAADGIDLMFHVAATYRFYTGSKAADEEMIRDSLDGVEAAMRAAAKNRVRKVVLTSSIVTLPLVEKGGPAVDESSWRSDLSVPYFRAKVLAEKRAWELAEETGVNLVTVLPGAVIGPGFYRGTPSIDVIDGIMRGGTRMGAPDVNFPYVDIRDVISGHIMAAERDCHGRFVIIGRELPSIRQIARAMHEIDPAVPASNRLIPNFAFGALPFFDWLNAVTLGCPRMMTGEFVREMKGKVHSMVATRAQRELGWRQEYSLEQSLADTMARLHDLRAGRHAG